VTPSRTFFLFGFFSFSFRFTGAFWANLKAKKRAQNGESHFHKREKSHQAR
jgi:hypothetical protein